MVAGSRTGIAEDIVEYTDLDKLIADLHAAVEDSDPQKGYWKQLWSLVREVGEGFKGVRYSTKEEREQAWSRFQDLVGKAQVRSEKTKRRVADSQRAWERRENRSRQARNEIQSKATGARPSTPGERAFADLILAPVTMIQRVVESIFGIDDIDRLEEIRRELVGCNRKLNDAWGRFNEYKRDLLPGDKNEAYQILQSAREILNEGWRQWKEAKAAMQNRRHQDWVRKEHDREARRKERETRHRAFVDRVEGNIENLRDKLANARAALEKQESHLKHLRDQYASAWSDGFRDRCSGWMDETEDRIASIKDHIERLEGWIEQERDKLR